MKNELNEFLSDILFEIRNLLIRKNESYGNAFLYTLEEFGLDTLLIRLIDKYFRLKFLIKNKKLEIDFEKKKETIEDTLKDIIGYCLLGLFYLNKNKKEK